MEITIEMDKDKADSLWWTTCDGFYYIMPTYFQVIEGNIETVSTSDTGTRMFFHNTYMESVLFSKYLEKLNYKTCILYVPIDEEDEDFENIYDNYVTVSTIGLEYPFLDTEHERLV